VGTGRWSASGCLARVGELFEPRYGSFALPCSITWNVPARAADLTLSGQLLPPAEPLDVTAFVYLDGRLDRHCHFQNGCFRTTIPLHAPETVTVIVVSAASVCEVSLYHAFDHRLDVGRRYIVSSR